MKFHRSITLTIFFTCHAFSSEPISALIAGLNTTTSPATSYLATVSPLDSVTQIDGSIRRINSVAINNSGVGLAGGQTSPSLFFGAYIFSPNDVQRISLPLTSGSMLESVAINNSNLGLIGGVTSSVGYAAFVSPDSVTPIALNLTPISNIVSVALNDSGVGLIGGQENRNAGGPAYAALVHSGSNTATKLPIHILIGEIASVAMNDSGLGLIGGINEINSVNTPYAAFVSNQSIIPIATGLSSGYINQVSINNKGIGLIGGGNTSQSDIAAYAAFVSPGTSQSIVGLPPIGSISSVAINDAGHGIIGGFTENNTSYAALVALGQTLMELQGLPVHGIIQSVAINEFGQGLIGGIDLDLVAPYAAIVSPLGSVIPLNLGFKRGSINAIAINSFFLSQIPTQGLKGNNLIFAKYITENAPQDSFYFVPSAVDGTLSSALESAAPTRNMISYNTVMQNSFYLTSNLSAHLRNQRLINARAPKQRSQMASLHVKADAAGELLVSRCLQPPKKEISQSTALCPQKTMGIWLDIIGILAYQHAQQQTTAFNPESVGGTFGFDTKAGKNFTLGGGGSYFYTHVHEKNHQGHSNIQQEDLFAYASWQPNNFYVDLGIWGGLFQTKQTRSIQMTGFDFKSTSSPRGWQVVPHLELGFLATAYCSPKIDITWNLLGMADWANAWQQSYSEKGIGPFNVHQNSHYGSLLRAEGGLKCSETLFFQTWNVIFQEKGSYVNIHSFKAGQMQAFLIGSPGSFTVQTLTNAQNLGLVQLSVTAAPYKSSLPTTMLMYQGEFGSGYQSHQLTIEFYWNFSQK